jgi:uncharacterized protein HemY
MKRFIEGADRTQVSLLRECVDDYVAEDNPVRVIEAFVEQLDLREIATSTRWEALPRFAEAYGEDHPDTARALAQWGKLRHKQHEYADAERLLHCALVIRVSKLPDDHPLTSTTRLNLGRVLTAIGQLTEAESLPQQTRVVLEKTCSPTSRELD